MSSHVMYIMLCNVLFNRLQAVVFEPGRFLPSRLYGQVPQLVPAEDPELLGTAFGLLTNELAQSPEATIDAVLQLLEQAPYIITI